MEDAHDAEAHDEEDLGEEVRAVRPEHYGRRAPRDGEERSHGSKVSVKDLPMYDGKGESFEQWAADFECVMVEHDRWGVLHHPCEGGCDGGGCHEEVAE